jgi:hypothetical protein
LPGLRSYPSEYYAGIIRRSAVSAGRIVLLVFGILLVIVSIGLIIGGGVALAVDNMFKDSQGFYTSGLVSATAPNSSAIVTRSADIRLEPGWYMRQNNMVTLKVEASNTLPGKPIFVGIARETDLRNYLNGVSYDEVTGFDFRPYRMDLIHYSGTGTLPPPTEQSFWVVSAAGPDTQSLRWDVTSGTYSLAIMNADGSSPVDSRVSLGIKIPAILRSAGLGLLIGGIVFLIIGGTMVFFAARGR